MNVISYTQLVRKQNGKQIQKGMNFAIQKTYSVVLMSTQKNAPYNDHIFEDGVIEYEGHDVPANINPEKKVRCRPNANHGPQKPNFSVIPNI